MSYTNACSKYFKGSLNKSELEKLKEEKIILSNLLYSIIETDMITEFNDELRYVNSSGKWVLSPTISQCYTDKDRYANIITPNIKEDKTLGRLTITKTTYNNPYGIYDYLITPKMIKDIDNAGCFITTKKLNGLDKRFKAWAGMGVPCCFLISGENNKETLKRDENVQKFMDSLVKNNQLSIEEGFIDDNLNNMFYKAYVLKR